jgi:hypothetical protein
VAIEVARKWLNPLADRSAAGEFCKGLHAAGSGLAPLAGEAAHFLPKSALHSKKTMAAGLL